MTPHDDAPPSLAGADSAGWLGRTASRLEFNRAVAYALLLRGWQFAAGAVSAVLIAVYFTPDVQGYYYTFSSLLVLQALFELGCGHVVTNLCSHEWAALRIDASGRVTGDAAALSRLVHLSRLLFRLYGALFVVFTVAVGFGGAAFLAQQPAHGVQWREPWFALVAASGLLLWMLPFNSLLEGCNQVTTVNSFRLIQAVCANVTVWVCLVLRADLWVAVFATGMRVAVELVLLLVRYRRFFASLIATPANVARFSWSQEVWPLQWRLGLQGAFGFLSAYLFVPVMFHYQSKAVAGRMGMTWMMLFAVQAAAMAWVQTRIPQFGMLVARREYAALDRLFARLSAISIVAVTLGGSALCGAVLLLNEWQIPLADRMLSPLETAAFAAAFAALQWSHCLAAYLRAHKRDPLWTANLVFHVASGAAAWYFGSRFGPLAAGLGYLGIILLVNTPVQTAIWMICRREWHREGG